MADSPQPGGWIKLYRSFHENGHFQRMTDNALRLWIYLLLRVNHKAGAGCQSGEAWIAYHTIREECCVAGRPPWNNTQISNALKQLEDDGYIKRIKSKNGLGQKVRVTHWERYQGLTSTDMVQVPVQVEVQEPVQVPVHKQEGEESKEEEIPSPPSAEATAKPRQRTPPKEKVPKAEKEPDPFNVAAQPLVDRLNTWRKEQGLVPFANWGAQVAMAGNCLKGQKAGAPIPPGEAMDALEWGFTESRWREQFKSKGMTILTSLWAAWTERGSPRFGGNRYQDHTKTLPTGKSLFKKN